LESWAGHIFLHRKPALARIPRDSCIAQDSDRRSTLAFSLDIMISEGDATLPQNSRDPITQWCSILFQKNKLLNYMAVKTSKLSC